MLNSKSNNLRNSKDMIKEYDNQSGFGAVEALLIVVIVALIGFVGWFVYNSNQKASNTINSANQANSNSGSVSLTSTKTADAAGTRAKNIATALLVYEKGNKSQPAATYLQSYVNKHVNDGEFTSAFKTAADNGTAFNASGADLVSCTSGIAPSTFKVASSTLNGDTAVVKLDQLVSNKTTGDTLAPEVTLQYLHSNWSIDQYACVTK